ncbi:MAG: hypothetical protein J6P72_03200, partial [Firmicutes bacterium]|nr:hypothetical protein [Bacillota bacterium]
LGQGAASAGETQKTSGPSAADVAAKWPVFRDELIRQSRNLYTLTKVDMQPGNGPDELFLVASEQIYIDQLSMQDGEKLKIIIDFIRKKTGKIFTIRLIRQEEKKVWTKEDFASNIHMDIHWQS